MTKRRSLPLTTDDKLEKLAKHYLNSEPFRALAGSSQKIYESLINRIIKTKVRGKNLGNILLKDITSAMCGEVYSSWVQTHGPSSAQQTVRIFSVLMTHGMANDVMQRNPMAVVKKVKVEVNTVEWEREQVVKFIDVGFSKFRWRNTALICLLCYEWCQRPVDIVNLKWYNIDFDKEQVTIKQQKRKAEVYLPVTGSLKETLLQQKEDFGFQEYVAPYFGADKAWKKMPRSYLSNLTNEILTEANLPLNLNLGSLRKTGILEMRDEGVDQASMMSVTGHASLASLTPYMKNTLKTARSALEQRKKV